MLDWKVDQMTPPVKRRVVFWSIILFVFVVAYGINFRQQRQARERAEADRIAVARVLAELPERFTGLRASGSTRMRANVYGTVASDEDRELVKAAVASALGSEALKRIDFIVCVESETAATTQVNK